MSSWSIDPDDMAPPLIKIFHNAQHYTVEDPKQYTPGHLHPVHIGDKFNQNRYTVLHKLGNAEATVWLASDALEQRYVALKILAANRSAKCAEADVLRRLHPNHDADSPGLPDAVQRGRECILRLYDEFVLDGPNGRHLCIVTPLVGDSVASAQAGLRGGRWTADQARAIVAQMAIGLAFIHASGVVHHGESCRPLLVCLAFGCLDVL